MSLQLAARHQPSGLNSLFNGNPLANGSRLSFADYVVRNRDMLRRAHAGSADLEKIVDGNAPFEMKPPAGFPPGQQKTYRRGVLLTHGLSDSPYAMRHLAEFFRENGFRVMAILLPGHGTQPGDLLDVRWQEWAKTVAYGAYQLALEVDELYLAGYSTGAALSIYHSQRDKQVRGLFLFSPAIEITRWAALANGHKLYSWLIPSAKWVDILPDRDIYKYESFAKNAAAQLYALTRIVHRQLRRRALDIPVYIAASADDTTVKTSAALEFIAHARHPGSKLVLYTTEPEKFRSDIPAEKLELVNSVFPEQKILSSAHTAIVMSPEDRHYGVHGDYANCVHYYPGDMEKYKACLHHPEHAWQGELIEKNLQRGVLRRLMYNPDFAGLKMSMRQFIESLP
ncbi:MAG: alpha/beta fold hydrolase [Nitrosomonadales bacterium]|nr:alpha/beta fold hydrolase [Nitrosomonadales bacterium]